MNNAEQSIFYPRLVRRVQAMLIDSVLIVVLFYVIVFLPPMGDWSFVKPAALCFGILILEPGLISFTGSTIGQRMLNIRVTRLSGQGTINPFAATVRFFVKTLFGWFSLLLVMTTRRHQALHDLAARSLVVYRKTDDLPQYEKLVDRSSLSDLYVMPSGWRRLMIMLGYFCIAYISLAVTLGLSVSLDCLNGRHCLRYESVITASVSLLWMLVICAVIIMGWRGQLFGARRKVRSNDERATASL